jgi:hypothetical protein
LAKRGEGRFSKDNFKIPLYPPLLKGDKKTITEALPMITSFLLPWQSKVDINWNTGIMACWNTGIMGDKE